MKATSAEAAKVLRSLQEQRVMLAEQERAGREFLAAMGEDIESVRPDYDYEKTQTDLRALDARIRAVKHAISCFNVRTEVPGIGMTIDQVLIYIPQLSEQKAKLALMQAKLPKTRETAAMGRGVPLIDYRYTNYDVKKAAEDYRKVSEELSRVQTALDLVNSTELLELPEEK